MRSAIALGALGIVLFTIALYADQPLLALAAVPMLVLAFVFAL